MCGMVICHSFTKIMKGKKKEETMRLIINSEPWPFFLN